jgi:hypothetical protein
MAPDTAKAFQCETDFLAAVDANFEAAKGADFRGTIWQRARYDETDRLRALMASSRIYDRDLLKSLPANRRVALHGFERRWLFGRRRTGVAIASVLSPLNHYVSAKDGTAPAIGLSELIDHVNRLVGDAKVPHIIGVCSPSGFTEEARRARLDIANAAVVLVEPDGFGGWRTMGTSDAIDPRLLKIFDPEGANQKVERVRRLIDDRSADLLTGGLSASSVARAVNLPEEVVRQGFEKVAETDPELKVAKKDGEFLLFRGAPMQPQEKRSMNVIDRIRQLFSGEGDEAAKINLLAERRAALAQRRDRIYEDIRALERKEAELGDAIRAASTETARLRTLPRLKRLQKDIARQNAVATMLDRAIDTISTDIHNLTMIREGAGASVPNAEELLDHAVQAEEMLESLTLAVETTGKLDVGVEPLSVSDEDQALLAQILGTPARQKTDTPIRANAPTTADQIESKRVDRALESESGASAHGEPPHQDRRSRAPEAG